MIKYLFFILLACSSCGENRSNDVHFKSREIQTERLQTPRHPPIEKSEKHSHHLHSQVAPPSQTDAPAKTLPQQKFSPSECIEKRDVSIDCILLTRQTATELGLLDAYLKNVEFDKWLILFHDIPEDPPYSFEQKRLLQKDPDRYFPPEGAPSSSHYSELACLCRLRCHR
jgi:hypothetical protein